MPRLALLVCGLCQAFGGDTARSAEVDPRFDQARKHFQHGRVAEALEVYDQLQEQAIDPARVAIGQSQCFEFQGDWKASTQVLEAAVQLSAADPLLLARLAENQLAQGHWDRALEHLTRARELAADLPQVRLVAADLCAAQGRLQEADDGYHWFVKYYNQHQPEDTETLLLVARGASQYARWHSVPQIFDFVVNTLCPDALAREKDCWQAHWIAGQLLLEKFNRTQAVPELKRALAINPRVAEVHAALAIAALQDRGLAEAGAHVRRALESNPRSPFALCVQADILLEEDRRDDALAVLDQALAVNPRDLTALGRLAACRILEDGLPPAAELDDLFGRLDRIGELKTPPASRFGNLLREVAGWNPHPAALLFSAGEQLDARKKYDAAERCYQQAILSMPQLSGPKSGLGMLYMRTGNLAGAQQLLNQAFDADPYHVRVSNMRKVLKLLDGYESITTEHFIIRVDSEADRLLGRYIARYLEAEYPALVRQFGYEPPNRTQIEIYNNGKGLSAHQWFSARMVGLPWVQTIGASTGRIVAFASPTSVKPKFNWARVVKHEFVHVLTLQQTDYNIPHWFTEALAVLSEGSPRPELWNQLLIERVPRGDLLNLETLNQGFTRPATPNDWQMAYCQSRLYAEYMIDRFGPDSPLRLLAAYRHNPRTDQVVPQVFGVSSAVFEQGYRDYVGDLVGGLVAQKLEESVTPGAVEREFKARPGDPRVASRYAWELFKVGKRKDARKLAREVLNEHPTEPYAILVMAQLELRAEDVPAAIDWLEQGLQRDDPHPQVLDLLADLRYRQDDYAEAVDLYGLGLKTRPDHVPWVRGLALALTKQKDVARLVPVLERLVVIDGDNPGPRKELALRALEERRFDDAIRYAHLALQIDVLDMETHRILAQASAAIEDLAVAFDEYAVALELKPEASEVILELARLEHKSGQTAAARQRLEKLLEREPGNKPAAELLDELR